MLRVDPDVVLKSHAVAVHEGRIVALLPSGEARSRFNPVKRVVLEDHILIPGLINPHTHAAMSLMRGLADDLPLMEWLITTSGRRKAHRRHNFVHDGTLLACAEMLCGGMTCFNDMYFFPEVAGDRRHGGRHARLLGLIAVDFPTPYASDADDYSTRDWPLAKTS